MNLAKCPACGKWISNIYFEAHEPPVSKGGSLAVVMRYLLFRCFGKHGYKILKGAWVLLDLMVDGTIAARSPKIAILAIFW